MGYETINRKGPEKSSLDKAVGSIGTGFLNFLRGIQDPDQFPDWARGTGSEKDSWAGRTGGRLRMPLELGMTGAMLMSGKPADPKTVNRMAKLAKGGNQEALTELVQHFAPIFRRIGFRSRPMTEKFEPTVSGQDLSQELQKRLAMRLKKWDPEKMPDFQGYILAASKVDRKARFLERTVPGEAQFPLGGKIRALSDKWDTKYGVPNGAAAEMRRDAWIARQMDPDWRPFLDKMSEPEARAAAQKQMYEMVRDTRLQMGRASRTRGEFTDPDFQRAMQETPDSAYNKVSEDQISMAKKSFLLKKVEGLSTVDRRILELHKEGFSDPKIATRLGEEGYPTVTKQAIAKRRASILKQLEAARKEEGASFGGINPEEGPSGGPIGGGSDAPFKPWLNKDQPEGELGPRPMYHGTTRNFDKFDDAYAAPNSLFGPWVYATDNPTVASEYAMQQPPAQVKSRIQALQKSLEGYERMGVTPDKSWSMRDALDELVNKHSPQVRVFEGTPGHTRNMDAPVDPRFMRQWAAEAFDRAKQAYPHLPEWIVNEERRRFLAQVETKGIPDAAAGFRTLERYLHNATARANGEPRIPDNAPTPSKGYLFRDIISEALRDRFNYDSLYYQGGRRVGVTPHNANMFMRPNEQIKDPYQRPAKPISGGSDAPLSSQGLTANRPEDLKALEQTRTNDELLFDMAMDLVKQRGIKPISGEAGLNPSDWGSKPTRQGHPPLRELGLTPRALGTNSREMETNPRFLGTNPRFKAKFDAKQEAWYKDQIAKHGLHFNGASDGPNGERLFWYTDPHTKSSGVLRNGKDVKNLPQTLAESRAKFDQPPPKSAGAMSNPYDTYFSEETKNDLRRLSANMSLMGGGSSGNPEHVLDAKRYSLTRDIPPGEWDTWIRNLADRWRPGVERSTPINQFPADMNYILKLREGFRKLDQ